MTKIIQERRKERDAVLVKEAEKLLAYIEKEGVYAESSEEVSQMIKELKEALQRHLE